MNKMPIRSRSRSPRLQEGVMLLEALVAILIFTLGVIAVMGMQAVSIAQVSQAKYRADASYLAQQITGRIWTDQANITTYASSGAPGRAAWDATVASTLPNGVGTIAVAGRTVTVTITWQMPNEASGHRLVTIANINPS